MEKKQNAQKTQVFNVIILDRSGSMENIRYAAIDGFNETLAGIRKAQEKFADTQEHYVSLLTFCSCEMRKVFDKTPVGQTRLLTSDDYEPCCGTPLYDAMGFTLTAMRKYVKDMEDAAVVVTIITDGYENSSREYNGLTIKALIEKLRKEGWTFTYMGANQDATEVAMSMSIRNARNFDYNSEGTRESMRKDPSTRMNFFSRLAKMRGDDAAAPMSREERQSAYSRMADEAFDEEEK